MHINKISKRRRVTWMAVLATTALTYLAVTPRGAAADERPVIRERAASPSASRAPTAPSEPAAPSTPSAAAAVAGGQCGNAVTAVSHGLLRGFTWTDAQTKWGNSVTALYDVTYSLWSNALDKVEVCFRPKWFHWSCTLSARPCQAGGSSGTNPGTGPACHGSLSVMGGKAVLQSGAENKAIAAWQATAGGTYGGAYQTWSNAHSTSLNCQHNGLGPIQRRWECTATGQPCK